jgi:hypothetical protein
MKWKCLKCECIFDDSNKGCNCKESPRPWAPLNDKLEEISFEEWYKLRLKTHAPWWVKVWNKIKS